MGKGGPQGVPEPCHQPLAPGPEPAVRNVLGLEGRKGMSKGAGRLQNRLLWGS